MGKDLITETTAGSIGLKFILSCGGCHYVLGSSSKPTSGVMYCDKCATTAPQKSKEETTVLQDESRRRLMNKIFAQVGSPIRLQVGSKRP